VKRGGLDVGSIGWAFLGNAVFPRLASRLRWWTRSFRGFVAAVAFNTLVLFLIRQFVVPRMKAWAESQRTDTGQP
jgi:hypothetical protein